MARIKNDTAEENCSGHFDIKPTINSRKTSPTRLNPIAEKAEDVVNDREYQVPISKKLIIPTTSHAINNKNVPVEFRTNQTASKNETNLSANAKYCGSNSK